MLYISIFKGVVEARINARRLNTPDVFKFVHYPPSTPCSWGIRPSHAFCAFLRISCDACTSLEQNGLPKKEKMNKTKEVEPRRQQSEVTAGESLMLTYGVGACNTNLN